jgi:PAS domain S-box-containing protein
VAEPEVHRVLKRIASEWTITFDSIEFPIFLIDESQEIIRLNQAARALAGKEFSELAGQPLAAAGSGEPWETIELLVMKSRNGHRHHSEQVRDRATGASWEVSVHAADQEDGRRIIVARDISSTVRLQESLRKSEQLSAIGELVVGVAHQFRNPLFSISATLEAMEARFHDQVEGCSTYTSVLREELGRLNGLIQELLDFGKPVLAFESTRIGEVVQDAINACRPLAAEHDVHLETPGADGSRTLKLDRARLAQALQNVVENAIQHSSTGATVSLTAREVDSGEWVELDVRDHGRGFSPTALATAFEPFFTTRSGGTGLGLPIVQRIANHHGGDVLLANCSDGGARVTIRVPAKGDRCPLPPTSRLGGRP